VKGRWAGPESQPGARPGRALLQLPGGPARRTRRKTRNLDEFVAHGVGVGSESRPVSMGGRFDPAEGHGVEAVGAGSGRRQESHDRAGRGTALENNGRGGLRSPMPAPARPEDLGPRRHRSGRLITTAERAALPGATRSTGRVRFGSWGVAQVGVATSRCPTSDSIARPFATSGSLAMARIGCTRRGRPSVRRRRTGASRSAATAVLTHKKPSHLGNLQGTVQAKRNRLFARSQP